MRAILASWELHEIVPIVCNFPLTTGPILLQIMEYCLTFMVVASGIIVLIFSEGSLCATTIPANKFSVFRELHHCYEVEIDLQLASSQPRSKPWLSLPLISSSFPLLIC